MADKKELTDQLIELTKAWNETDLVPDDQQARCKEIGEALNKLGGVHLMQEVYYKAHAKNRCASVVQAYWDGIGFWRW